MTALTIGRASSLSTTSAGMRLNGRALSVEGNILAASAAEAAAKRQQLIALTQPGEEVVPISYTTDTTFDGFYRVTAVTVENHPGANQKNLKFSLEAQRVDGFAAAQFESVVTEVVITNTVSLPTVSNLGMVGIPAAATEASGWVNLATGASMNSGFTFGTRDTETGDVALSSTSTANPFTASYRWACPIANYYDAAAMIEVQGSDSTWRPFCGQDAILIATSWRISNSLVRITMPAATGVIALEAFNGSTWDTAKNFQVVRDTTGPVLYDRVNSVRVLRNRPESVTVRVGIYISSLNAYGNRDYIDITVRRGMMFFDVLMSGASINWGLTRTTNEASTSITGGLRATSADAAGNYYWYASPVTATKETTIGRLVCSSAATSHHMGFGVAINGSTSDVTAEINRWVVSCSERHEVVSR